VEGCGHCELSITAWSLEWPGYRADEAPMTAGDAQREPSRDWHRRTHAASPARRSSASHDAAVRVRAASSAAILRARGRRITGRARTRCGDVLVRPFLAHSVITHLGTRSVLGRSRDAALRRRPRSVVPARCGHADTSSCSRSFAWRTGNWRGRLRAFLQCRAAIHR
jgi:hypothetical protein